MVKTYTNLEPRLSVSYQLNDASSIKASYNRNTQVLHLISNSTSSNPTDLWIPSSSRNAKPEIADQSPLGISGISRTIVMSFLRGDLL